MGDAHTWINWPAYVCVCVCVIRRVVHRNRTSYYDTASSTARSNCSRVRNYLSRGMAVGSCFLLFSFFFTGKRLGPRAIFLRTLDVADGWFLWLFFQPPFTSVRSVSFLCTLFLPFVLLRASSPRSFVHFSFLDEETASVNEAEGNNFRETRLTAAGTTAYLILG